MVARHTEVLGNAQLVCRTSHILDASCNKAPFHQRCPEEDGLRTLRAVSPLLWSCSIAGLLPAGWFINAWNFEAPAAAAGPDIFYGLVVYPG
jgi:hypothetical protein